MNPANELLLTAYHEAGHAVMALMLDLGPGDVTIKSDGQYAGIALDDGEFPRDEDAEALSIVAPEAFRMRHAVAYYAGAHATRRAGAVNWRDGADQDYGGALQALDDVSPDRETVEALVRLSERRAEILVGHYWPEIEALALALVERETVAGEEVRTIVAASLRSRGSPVRVW